MNETVTQAEAATRVGVTAMTIAQWIKSGRLPARKAGRIILIDVQDLESVNEWSLKNDIRQHYMKRKA